MNKRFSSDYASSFVQRDSTLEVVTSARVQEMRGATGGGGGGYTFGGDGLVEDKR